MSEQLYRVKPETGKFPSPFTLSELSAMKFHRIHVDKPECDYMPRTEWYCWNPECVVREVEINVKLYGEKLPEMTCPACKGPMEMHGYIEYETLVPVNADDAK